jgi:hypothetical protein
MIALVRTRSRMTMELSGSPTRPNVEGVASQDAEPQLCLRGMVEDVLAHQPWQSAPGLDALRCSVESMAAMLRDRGYRPEQMVIALKRAVGRRPLQPVTGAADELHYRMIAWSVREYFRVERPR